MCHCVSCLTGGRDGGGEVAVGGDDGLRFRCQSRKRGLITETEYASRSMPTAGDVAGPSSPHVPAKTRILIISVCCTYADDST